MIISRELSIDAGHRIAHHGGMCRGLHGHRYRVVASVVAMNLGDGAERDMAIDFGTLKRFMMEVLHDTCDHALMLECTDPLLETLGVVTTVLPGDGPGTQQIIDADDAKIVILPKAPTAERLAEQWGTMLNDRVTEYTRGRCELVSIEVWETPNCSATWHPPISDEEAFP